MDGGAWWATVHSVAKSHKQLSDFTFTFNEKNQNIVYNVFSHLEGI